MTEDYENSRKFRNNDDFDFENEIYKEEHITKDKMLKNVNDLLAKIKKLAKGQDYSLFQHNIWTRFDNLERIRNGFFKNGLHVNNPGVASTALWMGNIKKLTAKDVLNYTYDTKIDNNRENLGIIIPNYIVDAKGRKLHLTLEEGKTSLVPFKVGCITTLLDMIVAQGGLSYLFSLFYFELKEKTNDFSFFLNINALPFLNKAKKQEFNQYLCKTAKSAVVERFKFMTAEEYDRLSEKDLNQKISDKLLEHYLNTPEWEDPDYWEFP